MGEVRFLDVFSLCRYLSRYPGEGRGPVWPLVWIPACAGMTISVET